MIATSCTWYFKWWRAWRDWNNRDCNEAFDRQW